MLYHWALRQCAIGICAVHLTIRSKLIIFTVLPVVAVFSVLFWLGVSHVREHLSSNAQSWLGEHAHHQASRLELVLSQVPLLARSLGDLVLAEPGQSQTLMYAHLIDGLRRLEYRGYDSAGIAILDGDRIRALYGHSIDVEPGESSKPPPRQRPRTAAITGTGKQARSATVSRNSGIIAMTSSDS